MANFEDEDRSAENAAWRFLDAELEELADAAYVRDKLYISVIANQFFYVACRLVMDASNEWGAKLLQDWCARHIKALTDKFDERVKHRDTERALGLVPAEQAAIVPPHPSDATESPLAGIARTEAAKRALRDATMQLATKTLTETPVSPDKVAARIVAFCFALDRSELGAAGWPGWGEPAVETLRKLATGTITSDPELLQMTANANLSAGKTGYRKATQRRKPTRIPDPKIAALRNTDTASTKWEVFEAQLETISKDAVASGDLNRDVIAEQFFYVACKIILEESKDFGDEWKAAWCNAQIRYLKTGAAESMALLDYLKRDDADLDMLRAQQAERIQQLKDEGSL